MIGFLAGLLGAALVFAGILLVAAGAVYVVSLALIGVLVGAIGRVAGRRPDPKWVGTTLLVGVGGAFLGGLGGWFLFHRAGGYALSLAGATFVVWLTRHGDRPPTRPGRGPPSHVRGHQRPRGRPPLGRRALP